MHARVMGEEAEHGLANLTGDEEPSALTRELIRQTLGAPGYENLAFLANGAKLYCDVGGHPEYATEEVVGARRLVIAIRAGEEKMTRGIERTQAYMEARGDERAYELILVRNNTDSKVLYGCHENYLLERRMGRDKIIEALATHLATRSMYTGAGRLLRDGTFEVSQRAPSTGLVWSDSTTNPVKPMLAGRDEPHATADAWRRQQVICSDTLMGDMGNLLKYGATDLVLRVFEEGLGGGLPSVDDPIKAFKALSTDPDALVDVGDGKRYKAVEIQEELLGRARSLEVDSDEAQVLVAWEDLLERSRDGWEALVGITDWATKKMLIERAKARGRTHHHQLAWIDLAWGRLGQGARRGLARRLEERGSLQKVVTAAEVEAASEHGVGTPRALARGRFVRAANQLKKAPCDVTVDWSAVRVLRPRNEGVLMGDPWKGADSAVDEIIAKMLDGEL